MAHQHTHVPGEFPEVHDEAPPTPTWVPLIGLALLAALTFYGVYLAATTPDEPAMEITGTPAAEAEGEAAPAPEGPPAPSPAAPPAAQPAAQPAAPPAAPGGGGDSFGRQPGDEHFGHDHP